MENSKRELIGKIWFLQVKISDAEMEIAEYKELENKAETQDLKIDHLEKMLDEKILENEMQKMRLASILIFVLRALLRSLALSFKRAWIVPWKVQILHLAKTSLELCQNSSKSTK